MLDFSRFAYVCRCRVQIAVRRDITVWLVVESTFVPTARDRADPFWFTSRSRVSHETFFLAVLSGVVDEPHEESLSQE